VTERERLVALGVADGSTAERIGARLGYSARQVSRIRSSLGEVVGAAGLPELLRWCEALRGLPADADRERCTWAEAAG